MVYNFDKPYYEEIAEVSEYAEWETATIEVRDPSLVTSVYDIDTNEYVLTGNPVLFTARARGIGIRASLSVNDTASANPTGIKAYRWQFPHAVYSGKIKRGFQVRVTVCDRNPSLLSYVFVVDADNLSTNQASRTLECTVNVETDPGWS